MGSNREKLALLKEARIRKARICFLTFRKTINPKAKWGWWQEEVAAELQSFFDAMARGERPKLVIQAPPQHGKSVQIIDFIAWLAGKNPDLRTIYTSFSDRLGIRANLRLQRLFSSDVYQEIFPGTAINKTSSITASGQYLRNREILEYVGREGFFRNTTVRGSITGESLDFGVIDDPIRGRADANSEAVRNAAWDWFTDDFFTRFSEDAGMLAILTRWHVDDPIGRLIERFKGVKVLSYPAVAIKDEPHRKEGEALFPEHKSLGFLLERKAVMDTASWTSLYQQSPTVMGGEIIKGTWFARYRVLPPIKWRKIFADTAQKTAERNDYSVFECWGLGDDGKLYLLDLIRDKWEAPELRRRAIDFWNKHKPTEAFKLGALRQLCIEDKSSGTGLIQDIKTSGHIPVKGIQRTKDKLTRVMDVVSFIESGYVCIPEEAPWVSDFVAECESFQADDGHDHDDQIDPMCDAITDMLTKSTSIYDSV